MSKWREKNSRKNGDSKISSLVGARINGFHQKWATGMNTHTRHWSKKSKMLFFVITCAVLGGGSLVLACHSVLSTAAPVLESRSISVPVLMPDKKINIPPHQPDSSLFIAFYASLDSLRKTEEGRKKLDKYLSRRPGFLDSITDFERKVVSINDKK